MNGLRLHGGPRAGNMGRMEDAAHPGTITYVDGNTDKVVRVAEVGTVPEHMRFAKGPNGELIPVVKVVATTLGDQRHIRELGPSGQLLRHTTQVKR